MKKPILKIYHTTNWPAYNRALINHGNIAIWFDPKTQWYAGPQGRQGRSQTYFDIAIQCCLMIKSLFRLTLRMVTGFVQSLIKLCGWVALQRGVELSSYLLPLKGLPFRQGFPTHQMGLPGPVYDALPDG